MCVCVLGLVVLGVCGYGEGGHIRIILFVRQYDSTRNACKYSKRFAICLLTFSYTQNRFKKEHFFGKSYIFP